MPQTSEKIYQHLQQLMKLLLKEQEVLVSAKTQALEEIEKEKKPLLEWLESLPTHQIQDALTQKEHIAPLLEAIRKQLKLNTQLAVGRAQVTHARITFISEQLAASYSPTGKQQSTTTGGLFNSSV